MKNWSIMVADPRVGLDMGKKMPRVRAYPTDYHGVRFRSRLEARWAAFFDRVGWPWDYEPLDFDGYIPDFLLKLAMPTLVEVKPAVSTEELLGLARSKKIERLKKSWDREILLVGATTYGGVIGVLVRCSDWGEDDAADAVMMRCRKCGRPSFYHYLHSYSCRVCGGGGGDHHIGQFEEAEYTWRCAGNDVKWSGSGNTAPWYMQSDNPLQPATPRNKEEPTKKRRPQAHLGLLRTAIRMANDSGNRPEADRLTRLYCSVLRDGGVGKGTPLDPEEVAELAGITPTEAVHIFKEEAEAEGLPEGRIRWRLKMENRASGSNHEYGGKEECTTNSADTDTPTAADTGTQTQPSVDTTATGTSSDETSGT